MHLFSVTEPIRKGLFFCGLTAAPDYTSLIGESKLDEILKALLFTSYQFHRLAVKIHDSAGQALAVRSVEAYRALGGTASSTFELPTPSASSRVRLYRWLIVTKSPSLDDQR